MSRSNFPACEPNVNSLNMLMHLPPLAKRGNELGLMTSQRPSIPSVVGHRPAGIPTSNYAHRLQFDSPFRGYPAPRGVENCTNRNVVPTFLFDLCAHHGPILYPFTRNAQRGTERSDIQRDGEI